MQVTVLHPGALCTVQDLGRPGYRDAGVSMGGAVDASAMRLANLSVGNEENAAGLESALVGPRVRFSHDAVMAVGGAVVDGIEPLRPIRVRRGQTISLQRIVHGCRAYLAIAGGIDVPIVLGGRGTDLRGGFGGYCGRTLRRGDELPIGPAQVAPPEVVRINADQIIRYVPDPIVRVLRGRHAHEFSGGVKGGPFTVSPQSDRTGLRLSGRIIARREAIERLSLVVTPGTIQVPPLGEPIILLADAPTIGGYPVIAHVITADLPLVAQLRPGDTIGFREVSIAQAQAALREQEQGLNVIRQRLRA